MTRSLLREKHFLKWCGRRVAVYSGPKEHDLLGVNRHFGRPLSAVDQTMRKDTRLEKVEIDDKLPHQCN